MNINKVIIVYRKELKDVFREKKAVLMMILLPLLLYPLLMIGMSQLQAIGGDKLNKESSDVAISGKISDELIRMIKASEKLKLVQSKNTKLDLKEKKIDSWIEKVSIDSEETFLIHYDGAMPKSRIAERRTSDIVYNFKRFSQEQTLKALKIEREVLDPFAIKSKNSASKTRMGGMLLGMILPLLLIVTMLMGAMYPAIDLTAGEKERGTLETILTTPIHRTELLSGKFLTVATTALITGFLNLSSMMMTYSLGLVQMGQLTGKMDFTISPLSLVIMFILVVPIALLISSVMISASLFTKSFKDASSLLSPVLIILMTPALISLMPGMEIDSYLAVVPITNVSLLFKEIFLGNFQWHLIFLAFLSNSIAAVLFISIVSKLYNAESILFSEDKGFNFSLSRKNIQPGTIFEISTAFIIIALILLLQIYGGGYLQLKYPIGGLLISQWFLIVLPVLLFTWFFKLKFKKVFFLKKFSISELLAAVLLAISGFGIATMIGGVESILFPEAYKSLDSAFKPFMDALSEYPLIFQYFVMGVTAGVCEEFLFRGVFLSSLKNRMPKWSAIIIVAVVFGLFHMHLLRLPHTILLGILLTYLVYRTESLYLSIIAHFLINSFAVTLKYIPNMEEYSESFMKDFSSIIPVIVITFISLALGIFIVEKSVKNRPSFK